MGSLHTSPDWGGVHLAPGTPPPPYDTHLLSACEALKRWDPISPAPATTTGSGWVPGMGWREARLGVGPGAPSGSLDHHLELTWKRRAGFSLRLGPEGRGSTPVAQRCSSLSCANSLGGLSWASGFLTGLGWCCSLPTWPASQGCVGDGGREGQACRLLGKGLARASGACIAQILPGPP